MLNIWRQTFPQAPQLTEANLPSQRGTVCIVTGGTSGVGYELSSILYSAGAKVYLTGRSKDKLASTITKIQEIHDENPTKGELHALHLQLDDLTTIKASADAFKSKESHVDVLFNNAGIGGAPGVPPTKQGYDVHVGTNALGPFLFTKLLLPELRAAAKPRVIWTSSMLVDAGALKGGFTLQDVHPPPANDSSKMYIISKTANCFLASEFQKRCSDGHIVSVAQNPGNLKTDVWRHQPSWVTAMSYPILYEQKYGAYTNLWAAFSPEVTLDHQGEQVIPWGRWQPLRSDVAEALKSTDEGGSGRAAEFWDWCEEQVQSYS